MPGPGCGQEHLPSQQCGSRPLRECLQRPGRSKRDVPRMAMTHPVRSGSCVRESSAGCDLNDQIGVESDTDPRWQWDGRHDFTSFQPGQGERAVTPSAGPPSARTAVRVCSPARIGYSSERASSWSAGVRPALRGSCGRGSVGRASPCQGEGRGFESRRPLGGVGRRIAVPMASTAPGDPWCGFLGSGHGGVAEWPRQGPAKPCTRVRFPPPPRGRLAQWESATLTR
jgi:hypothetical protein